MLQARATTTRWPGPLLHVSSCKSSGRVLGDPGYSAAMPGRSIRWNPFKSPASRHLALLFGTVYFAQGMWYLPNQTITISLKDGGLSAGQIATFFAITTVPWLIKPIYGLLSDFLPLFGYHRKSYLLFTSGTAAMGGFLLALTGEHSYLRMATLFTLMALGLAFTDVLVDALMVENGKPLGLTGAFQSVQWGAIITASILVGEIGGHLAHHRRLHAAFLVSACFPLLTLVMTVLFVREAPARSERASFRETWKAIRVSMRERETWLVAAFILCWTFSPSFGPAFLFYQTDVLHFDQRFIGHLSALASVAGVVGAFIYAPLSRRVPLRRLINLSIGIATLSTLAYLVYRDWVSAVIIDVLFGCVGMVTRLSILDLAAKACPRHVEATFFAFLMSVYNGGTQISENVGARLYDSYGYTPLVLVSTVTTAAVWLLVPFVRIDRIEAKAKHAEMPPT
jgi:predicted MFS family arabinose efflux permease